MNDQTQALLEKLADKLGTSVDHLWGVLVRQAPISSSVDVATMMFCTVYAVLSLQYFRKWAKAAEDISISAVAILASGSLAFLVVFVGVTNLPTILAGFANPEFWALKQLLK